ncbi:TBC1 domain family member 19-like [Pollicipes pollicipes]|uniref:TBC1 domain family member 19-like n=1 Tax=Pollicipes pollicipes TaxID=41117 RepID=UPI0018856A9F|nr:TBC1 domain family member 19-like [Pollicipes pollicipes]
MTAIPNRASAGLASKVVASHPELTGAGDYRERLLALVRSSHCERQLQNLVHQTVLSHPDLMYPADYPPIAIQEPIDYIRRAQRAWERRLYKSLNAMSSELAVPLARLRPPAQQQKMTDRPEEATTFSEDLDKFRPVYAPKDFLEVLTRVESPNYMPYCGDFLYGMVRLPLPIPDLADLRQQFEELGNPRFQHLSMSAELPAATRPQVTVRQFREAVGKKVLDMEYAPVSRDFAKLGVPQSLRGRIWGQILGVRIEEKHWARYRDLQRAVLQHDLLADRLVARDVQLTAGNDDQYFVFAEQLRATLLRFLRHTEPLAALAALPAQPARAAAAGASPDDHVAYPPCGVVPFHGFSMYLAPLCFVFSDAVELLFTFERLYVRYFVFLHSLSSRPNGIVSISLLLERLLREHEPRLWLHCRQCRVQPLRLVFRWLVRAFSGYLSVDQLLQLWDMLLAYDSLQLLALLAAAVLAYRRANLLAASNQPTMEAVLADLSSIRVVPLLRAVLGRWTS